MNVAPGQRYGLVFARHVDAASSTDVIDDMSDAGFVALSEPPNLPNAAIALVRRVPAYVTTGAPLTSIARQYVEATWSGAAGTYARDAGAFVLVGGFALGVTSPATPSSSATSPATSWWLPAGVAAAGVMALVWRLRRKANR